MQEILELVKSMPDYVRYLFTEHTVISIIAAIVFVFVLFFSNKVAKFFRTLFVIAILALVGTAYVTKRWPLMCISFLVLLVLFVFRLIGYIINTIRTNSRNKRIEERALERAAKRRGSWKNKQGYSGERKPIVEPEYVPDKMDKKEIDELIRHEKSAAPIKTTFAEETKTETTKTTAAQETVKATTATATATATTAKEAVKETVEAATKTEELDTK